MVELINEQWSLQTREYYSVLKTNDLSSHEKIWMKLEYILLSEKNP
jgi:hypothetical protein